MARPILVEILGKTSQFKGELASAVAATEKANGGFQKIGRAAGVAGLAITGVLAVGIDKAAKAAMAAETSTARLDTAFKTAHLSAAAFAGGIANAETSARKFGFENADVRDSLGSLVVATKSGSAALRDLGVAEDVARFKHQSLTDASKTLTMAMAGSQRAAHQLGIIVMPVTTNLDALKASHEDLTTASGKLAEAHAKLLDKMATGQAVIAQVSDKLHGQAQAFSDTAAGGMAQFHAQIGNLEEKMGSGLLPILSKLADMLSTLADYFAKHTELAKTLVIGLAALAAAFLATSVAAFVLANTLTLGIAAGVAAAVAGAVLLVKHWGEVKHALEEVWDWIDSHWPLIGVMLAGPVGLAVAEIATHIDAIKQTFLDMGNAVVRFFTALPGRIGDAISGAMGDLKGALEDIFSWHKIVGWIKDALGFHSPSPHFMAIGHDIVDSMARGVGAAEGILKDAVVNLAEKYVVGPIGSAAHAVGGAFSGGHSAPSVAGNVELGRKMAADYGWSGQFNDLWQLWQRESGWSATAMNPKSHAQGIPQLLPSAHPGAHPGFPWWQPIDASAQIAWGLNYIKGSYRDPAHAWAHEQAVGWYAKGGIVTQPTVIGVGEAGPEAIIPLTDSNARESLFEKLGWFQDKQHHDWADRVDSAIVKGSDPPGARQPHKRAWYLDYLAQLQKGLTAINALWGKIGGAYGHKGGGMPRFQVDPFMPFYGAQTITNSGGFNDSGYALKPDRRHVYFQDELFANMGKGHMAALEVAAHEWTHVFQKPFVLDQGIHLDKQNLTEGGAEILGQYLTTSAVKPYYPLAQKQMREKLGLDWALHQQLYDQGGFLQPGLTLALNKTGKPEMVVPHGGGSTTINVSFPNYMGDKRELTDVVTTELYRLQKRNGTTGIR